MFLMGMIITRVQKILKDFFNSTVVIISLIFIGTLIRIFKTLVIPNEDFIFDCVLLIDNCCLIILMIRLLLICFIESTGDIFRVLKKEIRYLSKMS